MLTATRTPESMNEFKILSAPVETGWNLLSFPLVFDDTSALTVVGSSFSPVQYFGGRYYSNESSDIEPGSAYWVMSNDESHIEVSGRTLEGTDSVSVPLSRGWNAVGSPFEEGISVADISISDGDTELSFQDAVSGGWIMAGIYEYTDGSYREMGSPEFFSPFRGYFVRAGKEGLAMVFNRE